MNLKIQGDLDYFWQWDKDRKLMVEDDGVCSQVHFCNGTGDSLVCVVKEVDGVRVADVPNLLLQQAQPIKAYLYTTAEDGTRTRSAFRFTILARTKPEDYIYTETEVLSYTYLDKRLQDLEGDGLANAVADYLAEHPVQAGATFGIVNPDKFSGTDSQKLQSAFDALSTSGGIISINRAYTLTADIKVSHDSSSYNNLITVKGDGQNAKIDFGAYCFQGVNTAKRSYGGIIFKDLWLSGTSIGFDCTHLIRLTFDNCMIRNFSNFLYCTDCLQSVYIMGCYIRASANSVADGSVREAIKSVTACDLKIIGCVCEQSYGLLNVTEMTDGCSITECCIEGYKGVPIVLGSKNRAVNISNNYFESNQGTHIDLTKATEWCAVSIYNNWFCEWNGMETVGAIFLPASFSNGYLTIVGNQCPYANSILLRTPDNVTDLSKVYAFANHGATNDTKGIVKMLTPDDLNNVKVELVKGEDYWTTEDKEEMVGEVLAAMSGEMWAFELADGSTFERTVATASLTEFDSETWTFTLADGSAISKVVSIV